MVTVRTSIFRPNLRFEVRHVANKHEKTDTVVELCRAIEGPIVVYARSRDACEELASRLRGKGVAAEHYHALVADRHGVQDRFMRGETRVLVATVAFGMGIDKADVRAIIHYNLPQSVESYYQEAGRAGRDGLPARCILLYAAADKGNLTSWLREDMLSKDYLREVYRHLRALLRRPSGEAGGAENGWGITALDDLRRDLREHDETRLRVALGLLERVGLVARHFDLPRAATLRLHDTMFGDEAFQSFIGLARLRPGQPLDVDLLDLAARAGCAPDTLELRLLRWHERGLLRYDGTARDMLLHLLPATADVGNKIDALLAEYASRQDGRIDAIADYARGAHCRHRAIAAHFGERLARCGSSCDICNPTTDYRPRPASRRVPAGRGPLPAAANHRPPTANHKPEAYTDDETILGCLAHLPFPVGRSGLAKVLKGSAGSSIGPDRCPQFAALSDMTLAAIEQTIEQLIERGYLARRLKGRMPLLVLTERGAAMISEDVVQ
jgi:ATP-dependent DNA helicase RecQ